MTGNNMMVKFCAALALTAFPLTLWAEAGKVVFASGEVAVRTARGETKAAPIGTLLDQGDAVLTRATGRAQIRFNDGGQVSLVPNTEFRIDQFAYAGKEDGKEKSFFSLVKGGLRAITGVVGHANKDAYKLDTGVAVIGIRGTEFQAILCSSSCLQPDGLYVHTGEGRIFVRNGFGEIDLARGQSGYVANANTPPQQTSTTPSVTSAPSSTKAATAPPTVPGVGNASEFQPGTIISSNDIGTMLLATGTVGLGGAVSGYFIDPDGISHYVTEARAGSGTLGANEVAGVYLKNGVPAGFLITDGTQFASLSMNSPPVDMGYLGGLYWGRWTNTTVTAYANLSSLVGSGTATIPSGTSVHYIFSGQTQPTIPGSGTATYSFMGGTSSTHTNGTVGSGITSGSLSADFLNQVVDASFVVNHSGALNVAAHMPFHGSTGGFSSGELGGTLTVNAVANAGVVEGFFAGTTKNAPSHAGVSYKLDAGAGNGIVGVGAFKCSSGC